MSERTILVTGATGRLGGLVARNLRNEHQLVPRVLVRPEHLQSPDWRAPANMDVVTGDYDDAHSLQAALAGVEAVFLISPVHPEMRRREMALAEQAARLATPPRIVKISGLGTRPDSLVDSGRWHAEIEGGIRALGLPATFLRPLFFMQNLGFQIDAARSQGVLRGAVADAAIAMVDARDIAEVAATVLLGGSPIEGLDVTLTGARAYTYEEIAGAFSDVLQRVVTYQRQSLDEARAGLLKAGQPGWHIEILLQFNQAFIQGWGAETSDTVQRVLGREPRSLEAYLAELAEGASTPGADPFPS
ncbi:MAG: NmrA family NAD(P)-binding protein [Gammaproteobacteria bacterium]|nr:NmrA family NAD(P)-binding protein [Gammaproteobacteria bacterium]